MLRPSLFARRFLSTSSTFTPRNATPETVDKLRQLLGDRLSTATSVREVCHHGKDESYHSAPPPDAVAFVTSTDEVSKVLQICSEAKTPVIPFGAGSSLEGHISAVCGGISLDLTGLNAILNVEPENMSCRVQAGVTRLQLESELRATGLFFPVDPGADATLGGMVATNASGTTTVELRLHGVPELQRLAVCSFPSIQQAVDTCTAIMQMGIPVARMEFMDEHTMAATNKYSKLHNAELPSLVIELNGTADDIENQTSMVEALTEEYDVQKVEWATSTEDRAELMKARHAAWYATLVHGNFHVMLPFVPADYPQIQAFSDRLIERALAAGGTCTGEHGIGLGKKKYLALEHGGATTDVMRAIKAALDPHEILNPGKLF
ncbi:hypothetical protein DYB30_006205 [Aphanomyces astaci]|uniref:D-lactate dehydrogenase (cytochrome) n=3 Tax=Aphanomyces astaci TaxID=112090 RepID=A0A397CTP1_APHAT|nr:hypothetical protein DYB30_006205 [Aphanomyces astaci]